MHGHRREISVFGSLVSMGVSAQKAISVQEEKRAAHTKKKPKGSKPRWKRLLRCRPLIPSMNSIGSRSSLRFYKSSAVRKANVLLLNATFVVFAPGAESLIEEGAGS